MAKVKINDGQYSEIQTNIEKALLALEEAKELWGTNFDNLYHNFVTNGFLDTTFSSIFYSSFFLIYLINFNYFTTNNYFFQYFSKHYNLVIKFHLWYSIIIDLERNLMMEKLIAKNPTAYHNYSIDNTIEAGIVLTGTEIKSIRNGKINLKDTYVNIKDGEVFVYGMHISPYEFGNIYNKDPLRTRKLLLNRREIDRLYGMIKQKGVSLVPTKMYFKGNKVKLEVGIGKGKKLFDKREDMAKKDAEMKIKRALKNQI